MTSTPLDSRDAQDGSERSTPGAILAALNGPWLGVLVTCARADAAAGRALVNLTEAEGRTVRAVAGFLRPADRAATEVALAAHFVDRAFDMRFFADALPVVRAGLADLDARAWPLGARDGFASLAPAQQAAVLRDVRDGAFYATLRDLVDLAEASADPARTSGPHPAAA
jgi:hypothetical protein